MENERRAQARELATSALDDLINPNLSIEVAIRKAMRVAALCGHPSFRAWLQLQLVDFRDLDGDLDGMRGMLQAHFPDDSVYQNVAKNVYADYAKSRSFVGIEDKMYGASIVDMETALDNARRALRTIGPDPEVSAVVRRLSQMYSRIKNRIQEYLTNIESGYPADSTAQDDK